MSDRRTELPLPSPKAKNPRADAAPRPSKPIKPRATARELELALVVVLVDLALADGIFDPREKEIIYHGVESRFGSSRAEVIDLINQATVILNGLRGSSRYTTILRENLDLNKRVEVVHLINDLIAADGKEEGLETYLRERYAKALGVTVKVVEVPVKTVENSN